jgi:hypothetical protein
MKRLVSALTVVAGIAALGACSEGPVTFDERASPQYAAGGPYDAYYDNAYGPIYDGYWSGDTFNYRTAPDQGYQADTGSHFRKGPAPGFQQIHGETHPNASSPPPSH